MRGFRVHGPDGTASFTAATRYEVDDDGDLVLLVGEDALRRFPAASWVTIDAAGRPLSATWPPDDLDLLLEQLRWKAGAGYAYTESEGAPAEYTSPLLNDLDAFLSRFLVELGLDPDSSDHKRMYAELRDLIRRHFTTNTLLPISRTVFRICARLGRGARSGATCLRAPSAMETLGPQGDRCGNRHRRGCSRVPADHAGRGGYASAVVRHRARRRHDPAGV
jgi:hypothetical protein